MVSRERRMNMGRVQQTTQEATPSAFEDILARLGVVVERLEAGDLPLEDSLALFEEGVRLSRLGATRLDDAERRVERLLNDEGATETLTEMREKENEAP
jgi:exodeoxyribonuclease VII small subunit